MLGAQPLNLNLGFIGEVHHVAKLCIETLMFRGKYVSVDLYIIFVVKSVRPRRRSERGGSAGAVMPHVLLVASVGAFSCCCSIRLATFCVKSVRPCRRSDRRVAACVRPCWHLREERQTPSSL